MKALITGISGQDGYFLSELLLSKGYDVHGVVRRNSQNSLGTLEHLAEKDSIQVHWGDITDDGFINNIIREEQFDEIYHLAAQSFVWLSFSNPRHTYDTNISGTLNVMNAIKEYATHSKLYFAATSEMFGKTEGKEMSEESIFHPRSPYGISKLAGFWTVKNYRESHGLFGANGLLFNHESEMRGSEFITRKITRAVANISNHTQTSVSLGNLEAKRDWGYAGDYVKGMWLMLQQDTPDDYVLATGAAHSVREFVEAAFREIGEEIVWQGSGTNEVGLDKASGQTRVTIDPRFYRPAEVDFLLGNATKAKEALGWTPNITFEQLVQLMVKADLDRV